ncbi:MAG TPA: hypothetical protein VEJ67_14220 [Candidatus Cybelea sp.]|nr:hypothetical protein [Candidatus Cybelea sp.]
MIVPSEQSHDWGTFSLKFARRTRLLAIALVLSVCALSTQVVAHSHGITHTEDHCTCMVCHATHGAVPHAHVPAQIPVAFKIARFTQEEQPSAVIIAPSTHAVPRAPPA